MNPLSADFENMMDEDDYVISEAYAAIVEMMQGRDLDFSVALAVALRDYISEAHEDESMGSIILKEVAKGLES